MKKILALIMSVLMIAGCFAGCSTGKKEQGNADSDLAYIKDKGTLIVGITDYAPMDYKDENGNWTGFDAEFAQAVATKMGVKVEFFELADWDGKINELNAKTIDVVWNGMTIKEDLKKGMDISNPYVVNAQVVVTKAANKDKYATAESIKEAKIAVEGGSAAEDLVEGYKNVTAVTAQSDALLEVQSGAADVAIIDITMAKAMTGEGTDYADLTYTASLSSEEYGIGCRKDTDTCAEINKIMAELMNDGTLDNLAKKYNLTLVK